MLCAHHVWLAGQWATQTSPEIGLAAESHAREDLERGGSGVLVTHRASLAGVVVFGGETDKRVFSETWQWQCETRRLPCAGG